MKNVNPTKQLKTSHPVQSLEEAVSIIDGTISGVETGYRVVPWKSFGKDWENRTRIFFGVDILCRSNKMQGVAWAVCLHVYMDCTLQQVEQKSRTTKW